MSNSNNTPLKANSPANDELAKQINYSYRLKSKKIYKMKEVFDLFDTNFDGYIEVENVGLAMRELKLFPTEMKVAEIINSMDPKKTGKVDLSTFFRHMAREFRDRGSAETYKKNLRGAFSKVFGKIATVKVEEFQQTLTASGEPLTSKEIETFTRSLDPSVSSASLEGIDIEKICKIVMK